MVCCQAVKEILMQKINTIPEIPVIPNPGIINISANNNPKPITKSKISKTDASCRMYDDPKNNVNAISPVVPATPQPGVFISAINPKNPIIIRIDETIGLFKNFTTSSAQLEVIEISSAFFKIESDLVLL